MMTERQRCRCGAEVEVTCDEVADRLRMISTWRSRHAEGCRYMDAELRRRGDPDQQ